MFSAILGYSRLHCFEYSKYRTRVDVQRSMVNVFKTIGGIPVHALTDHMSSIVNTKSKKFYPEFAHFSKGMVFIPKK